MQALTGLPFMSSKVRSQPEFLNAGRRAMGDENTYPTLDRELYRHEFVHAFALLQYRMQAAATTLSLN